MSSFFTLGHSNHDLEAWLALVRQHDFIVPTGAPSGPPAQGTQGATPDDAVPAVHA